MRRSIWIIFSLPGHRSPYRSGDFNFFLNRGNFTMTNLESYDERLAQLELQFQGLRASNNIETHNLKCEIADLNQRLTELEAKGKPLPFCKELTREQTSRIVKIRADLFHNPDAKQGGCKHILKVFVWFDSKKGQRGSIVPLEFWLNKPAGQSGYLTHKARKDRPGITGTVVVEDHEARCRAEWADGSVILRLGLWLKPLKEYEAIPAHNNPKAPIARWYWNKPE